jgi:hypothetical protein
MVKTKKKRGGGPDQGEERKYFGGRPALSPEERKANFTIRMRPDLRDQVGRVAKANGRSLGEEVETRLIASLKDDEIGDLKVMHQLIGKYLRTVNSRKKIANFDLSDPVIADALRLGLNLIAQAACLRRLPEERVKQFYLADLPALDAALRAKDFTSEEISSVIGIANEAMNALSVDKLVQLDPLKLSEWIRADAAAKHNR